MEAPFPGNRESQSAVSMMNVSIIGWNNIVMELMVAVINDVCVCPAVKEWGFSAVDPKGSLKRYTLCAIQTHTQELHLSTTKSPSAEGREQTHRFNGK